jgi:hypothetical protein
MTAKTPARPESRGRAQIRWVSRSDVSEPCICCREDGGQKLIAFVPPRYPPVDEERERAVLDAIEHLHLCDVCVSTAGRIIGVFRDPMSDPDVQKLASACEAASAHLAQLQREEADLQLRVAAMQREATR